MKPTAILTTTSLLSILLLTLHITDDIVRGISQAEASNTALIVLAVLLYGTLVLTERRSGHVIMLLVGLFAAGMPVLHMRGVHYPEIARSAGGFFFVWTLWAVGGLGGLTFILAAQGLWGLIRRRQTWRRRCGYPQQHGCEISAAPWRRAGDFHWRRPRAAARMDQRSVLALCSHDYSGPHRDDGVRAL